jgi:hypothetical protein
MFKTFTTFAVAVLTSTIVVAQTPPTTNPSTNLASNPTVRLRGVIEKLEPGFVTIKERRGETIKLVMADSMPMNEVYPIAISDIKAGSYIGTAAMPKPDGSLEALEVLVFPEAMRGTGEGHNPWDLLPNSTMTNATVADLVTSAQGRRLTLKYKGGEKIVDVPPNAPIVTFRPGEKSLLVVGAKVLVQAQEKDGKPTALRMTIGRDGFAPPM